MPRKYAFVIDAAVPDELAKEFPEHVEAGPMTLPSKLADMMSRLDPAYEIVEDADDYILHARPAKHRRDRPHATR